jgi:hypothetical protein
MDKLSKLESLLGEDQVSSEDNATSPWANVRSKYVYEGTDSEDDDEEIISGRAASVMRYSAIDTTVVTSGKTRFIGIAGAVTDFVARSRRHVH